MPAEIARRTKIPMPTVRYNMVKIRQQGNVEHRGGKGRPCKIPANINLLIDPWIRNYCKTNPAETKTTSWFEYVQMDNTTTSSSDGL